MSEKELKAKVVLVGGVGVGKTSIVVRFIKEEYNDKVQSTIGQENENRRERNRIFCLGIVLYLFFHSNLNKDTAGQEQFNSLVPLYFRKAACVITVYDITSKRSFEECKSWIREMESQAPKGVVVALLGNKIDLAGEHRSVSIEEGQELAKKNGALFGETSAKENKGITSMFEKIGEMIIENYGKEDLSSIGEGKNHEKYDGLVSGRKLEGEKKKGPCCSGANKTTLVELE